MRVSNFSEECPGGCLNALLVLNETLEHGEWNDCFAGDLDLYDKIDYMMVYYLRKLFIALQQRGLSNWIDKDTE